MTPPDRFPAALRDVRDALARGWQAYNEASDTNRAGKDAYDDWQRMGQAILDAGVFIDALLARGTIEYRCPRCHYRDTLPLYGRTWHWTNARDGLWCYTPLQRWLRLPLDEEASA